MEPPSVPTLEPGGEFFLRVGNMEDQGGPVRGKPAQRMDDRGVEGRHLRGESCGEVRRFRPERGVGKTPVNGENEAEAVRQAVAVAVGEKFFAGEETGRPGGAGRRGSRTQGGHGRRG